MKLSKYTTLDFFKKHLKAAGFDSGQVNKAVIVRSCYVTVAALQKELQYEDSFQMGIRAGEIAASPLLGERKQNNDVCEDIKKIKEIEQVGDALGYLSASGLHTKENKASLFDLIKKQGSRIVATLMGIFLKAGVLDQLFFERVLDKADYLNHVLCMFALQESIQSPVSKEIAHQVMDVCENEDIDLAIQNFPFTSLAFVDQEHIRANRAYFQEVVKNIREQAAATFLDSAMVKNGMVYQFFGVGRNRKNNHSLGEPELLREITSYII